MRFCGFTLIELLLVIAVIGILAAITFGISRGVQNAQARAKAKGELVAIAQALEQYKARYGDYPWHDSEDGDYPNSSGEITNTMLLYALTGRQVLDPQQQPPNRVRMIDDDLDNTEVQRKPKFIDITKFTYTGEENTPEALLDPWGNPYIYWYKWENTPGDWDVFGYHLYSTGPNGSAANDAIKEEIPDLQEGVLSDDFRDVANAQGIIFAGE